MNLWTWCVEGSTALKSLAGAAGWGGLLPSPHTPALAQPALPLLRPQCRMRFTCGRRTPANYHAPAIDAGSRTICAAQGAKIAYRPIAPLHGVRRTLSGGAITGDLAPQADACRPAI